jgi:hypothetical protein
VLLTTDTFRGLPYAHTLYFTSKSAVSGDEVQANG